MCIKQIIPAVFKNEMAQNANPDLIIWKSNVFSDFVYESLV